MNDTAVQYHNEDLVYVDPESKTIIGKVEWSRNGKLKSLPMPQQGKKEEVRMRKRKFSPVCSYKSARRIWKIGGALEPRQPTLFEDALAKVIEGQPYWD
ncbi:hypothetical protein COU77_03250 [Candidatus Peregrinibacteria bacterium CG10_big_fil_rev_8_21_14_0_10_49_16]|nr:MAG: hypothetical protein COW95_02045 [Candidatus Peregrinibacteria bacterium CG22_combo_CG10-13_8_21_14_all_49_11]PIR51905.1 MAG: hypothetical protein COU77_03250 [Candidatus Peregrinibacteria bacterium CG10_big_fil_rev_8_21_14_0_10_49_16]